jgi:putative phage-type endonuclease
VSARLVLPPDAPREEWLAARRPAITASEVAVILGISPFDSAFNLYYRKRGEISDDYDNDAMSLGRHLEPWIADRWAADHPKWHVSETGLWQSEERPWQMATPDRLLQDRGAGEHDWRERDSVLEIKSSGTYDGWGEDGTDQIPPYYRAQVLWQLDVLGLAEAHVTCFFLATRQRRDYVVAYDQADVELMRAAASTFLMRIEDGDPPPVDGHDATARALMELWPKVEDGEATIPAGLARRYEAAKKAAKKAKARVALAENEIRNRIGDAKTVLDPGGAKVATRSRYEVAEHTRAACTVDKLTAPRAKKEAS